MLNTNHSEQLFVFCCLKSLLNFLRDYLQSNSKISHIVNGFRYTKKYFSYFFAIIKLFVYSICILWDLWSKSPCSVWMENREKIETRKTPNTNTFYAVWAVITLIRYKNSPPSNYFRSCGSGSTFRFFDNVFLTLSASIAWNWIG